jgi:hypothetical protein
MPDNDGREQQILDAAVALFVRLGYDRKTRRKPHRFNGSGQAGQGLIPFS